MTAAKYPGASNLKLLGMRREILQKWPNDLDDVFMRRVPDKKQLQVRLLYSKEHHRGVGDAIVRWLDQRHAAGDGGIIVALYFSDEGPFHDSVNLILGKVSGATCRAARPEC